MDKHQISQDDLIDVAEMTKKIEKSIAKILADNEFNLAMSALISATINSLINQCQTLDEVIFHRNLFMQILDNTIRQIKIRKK